VRTWVAAAEHTCAYGFPAGLGVFVFLTVTCYIPAVPLVECPHSEVDWDVIWADVSWVRECLDHIRLEEHQVRLAVLRFSFVGVSTSMLPFSPRASVSTTSGITSS
jgi:hypothetical protein